MSNHYSHFLSSMTGVGAPSAAGSSESSPPMQQQSPFVIQGGGHAMPSPFQNFGYFNEFRGEPIIFNPSKSNRGRKRSAPGIEQIKHRRTRSGCYTCRSRRVKCDETRPICERCRKGKRDCVYPEPTATKNPSNKNSAEATNSNQQRSSPASSQEGEDEAESSGKLDPILDEDEDESENSTNPRSAASFMPRRKSSTLSFGYQQTASATRQGSETPSYEGKSSSPTLSTGTCSSLTTALAQFGDYPFPAPGTRPDWSFLPPELQFYLGYFWENMTHYHYGIVNDMDDFFHTILTSIAVGNETLLHAVVAFAAHHHTLQNPNGKIEDFLKYYNKSVTLLLAQLQKTEAHTIATLLTILQWPRSSKEYLGDWVNLMGHQRAAFEILMQLFTPQSIMHTPLSRMILAWYARYDVFVGIMGSFATRLPREWFAASVDFYRSQALGDPDNIGWKIEDCSTRLRLISVDMALLFGKGAKRELSAEEYAAEHGRLLAALRDWKDGMDPALRDTAFRATDFSSTDRPLALPTGADAFGPGVLYGPPIFATTILTCEWHSIVLMHLSQALDRAVRQPPADLMQHACAICEIGEAVESWPSSPSGSLIVLHASLAIAALFIPRDARNHFWIRRMFALLETMGYICPLTVRVRMAELFQDPSCVRWWLPNDEGYTPIMQSIRVFADERNATAVSMESENLREIRHVFSRMQIGRDYSEVQEQQQSGAAAQGGIVRHGSEADTESADGGLGLAGNKRKGSMS